MEGKCCCVSGEGSNSKWFVFVKMLDGCEVWIFVVKDVGMFVCLVMFDGGWFDCVEIMLFYDVIYLVEGSIFCIKEMCFGYGMG